MSPKKKMCNMHCYSMRLYTLRFLISTFQTGSVLFEASQHWQLTQWLDGVQTVWTVHLCRLWCCTLKIRTSRSCQSSWRRGLSTSTSSSLTWIWEQIWLCRPISTRWDLFTSVSLWSSCSAMSLYPTKQSCPQSADFQSRGISGRVKSISQTLWAGE